MWWSEKAIQQVDYVWYFPVRVGVQRHHQGKGVLPARTNKTLTFRNFLCALQTQKSAHSLSGYREESRDIITQNGKRRKTVTCGTLGRSSPRRIV